MSSILGKKIGMTQIFDETGNLIPVTVIEAGPCYVTAVRTVEKDGYQAVQLGFDEKKEKNVNKPMMGQFKKAGVNALRHLKEFAVDEDEEFSLGEKVTVGTFKLGDKIKVTSNGKGRGFAGVMKRHNFGGGQQTHGQSDRLRAPGSLGQSSYPSRVFKGMKMAGRMGGKRVAQTGLRIVKIDEGKNWMYVKGSVPGARNNTVEITNTL